MSKFIYNMIGSLSLAIGIVGAFLPLLPSTCFILLATWAFTKSSPKLHNWLYYHSPFSQSIQNWQQHRVIPTNIKWLATSSITISYAITLVMIDNVYVLVGLGVGLAALLIYLHSKPSQAHTSHQATYSPSPKLHQPIV